MASNDPALDHGLDLLVLGSGVAGLSAAVRAADALGLRVGVLTKGELDQAATRWAQGGVAAVLAGDPDSTDLHLADTLAAGAGLCDVEAVRVLVDEGPDRVTELIAMGAAFDRSSDGRLELAREGGHTLPRWCTREAPRRGPRSSARSSRPCVVPRSRSSSAGSRSTSSSRADAAAASRPWRRRARARGPCHARADGDRRLGSGVRGDDEPARVDGRRPRDGAAGRSRRRRHRVRTVPSHGAAPPGGAATAAVRSAARPRGAPARREGRAVRRRTASAWTWCYGR